jgi:tetratricopeptide (TPR) repeat protein
MMPERWHRIEELFQQALKRAPSDRGAFLHEVCADDFSREEVQSLISFYEKAEDFLETPAFEAAADLLCQGQAEEIVGLLIGPYRIEALLGAGGMGEVYLAEDTKLGRKVAIKFLPTYLETNEVAKKRLVKEARAAAKLDHPNICTIHEVVEEANHSFIVMQYVQGETLASRMQREPLSFRESIDVATQVADALVEAHSHGIIHRDIKPHNIMLTTRAHVKVLDFGLAKVVRTAGVKAQSQSQLSTPGIIVGTAPYMSPEQARGDVVDARSDLFSLGVVLYESVAGRAPFSGATAMEICAKVIHLDPPPASHFNRHLPPEVDAVLQKALAKDLGARYESAAEMLEALRAIHVAPEVGSTTALAPGLDTAAPKAMTTLSGAWRRGITISVTVMVLILALLALFKVLPTGHATAHQPSADALRWYIVGTNALRNGTHYDATIALRHAIAADDKFPLAHARLSEALLELGYVEKAKQEILRARSLTRNLSSLPRLDELYVDAITHMVLSDFASAIRIYEAIAREMPDTERPAAYVYLGRAYEKNNEVEKAIESYLKANEVAPSDPAAFLRLGILYSERDQNLKTALEAFQKAEELYQALRNFEGLAEVSYQRGFLLYNQDNLRDARVQLGNALAIAATTDNQYQRIRTMSALSNVSAAEGNATQAKQQANQAIDAARAGDIDNQVSSGFIWLGNISLMFGEYLDAEKSYTEALELAKKDGDSLTEAWALLSLGSLRTLQRKNDEGLQYLQPARLFYQKGGYRELLSLTLTLMGRAYRNQGEYATALEIFNDLLHQGEQANDQAQLALSFEEIGSVLAVQEQYGQALHNYNESYRINKTLNNELNLGYSAMHRGSALSQIGQSAEVRQVLDEASSIAMRPSGNHKHLLASIYIIEARLELREWHLRESRGRSLQALDLAGTQYKPIAVEAKYMLGLAQTRSGDPRAGAPFCEDAVRMARATDDPHLLASALLASAEVMLDSGQPQLALDTALQAEESFARLEQQESVWRAWLVASRAKQRLGDAAAEVEYASHSFARLSDLKQNWRPEDYDAYIHRPDVKHLLNQLYHILKLNA